LQIVNTAKVNGDKRRQEISRLPLKAMLLPVSRLKARADAERARTEALNSARQ
jgi:hypothetical protein